MKLNKEQRAALIARIESIAYDKIKQQEKEICTAYTPSEKVIEFKKQLEKTAREVNKLFDLRFGVGSSEKLNYCCSRYTEADIKRFIKDFEEEEIEEAFRSIPRYNFSNLENDLILNELDGVCVDDVVTTALTKYLVK